jgi:hypothetical protein
MSKNAKELGLADRASKMRQHWTEDSWKKIYRNKKEKWKHY